MKILTSIVNEHYNHKIDKLKTEFSDQVIHGYVDIYMSLETRRYYIDRN